MPDSQTKARGEGVTATPIRARDTDTEEVSKKGGCDGKSARFAMTNGVEQTWKWIENIGTCPFTFYCVDKHGNKIKSSEEEIPPGDTIVSYSSSSFSNEVRVVCPSNDSKDATCKIRLDH